MSSAASGSSPDQFGFEEPAAVRRVEPAVHVVEPFARVGHRHDEVLHHDASARRDHPRHLGHRGRGLPDVVQRCEAVREVERTRDERERLRIALLEQHVVHACCRESRRTELEQAGGEVDAHDLTHARRHDLGRVRGTAAQVEDEHAVVEGLELFDRSRGSPHERRVRAGEESDLTGERGADEVVVIAHVEHCYSPVGVGARRAPAKDEAAPVAAMPVSMRAHTAVSSSVSRASSTG